MKINKKPGELYVCTDEFELNAKKPIGVYLYNFWDGLELVEVFLTGSGIQKFSKIWYANYFTKVKRK